MGEPCDTGGPVPGAAALVDDGEAVYMYCEVGAGGWKYDSNYTEIVQSHVIFAKYSNWACVNFPQENLITLNMELMYHFVEYMIF